VIFDLEDSSTGGYRWKTDEAIAHDLFSITEDSEFTGTSMGSSGRKQFRLDSGSIQGDAIFYACETRARSVTYGEFSR
jgi:hypothetical protein